MDMDVAEFVGRRVLRLVVAVALIVAVVIGCAAFIGGYHYGQFNSEVSK
jgi:peptidoglycan/LPS O-acetylase OafA/YrhL